MLPPFATHRGAPFVGRRREIGIITHLLEEGLEGRFSLIRISGETGVGRRRLVTESLGRGPDAEWIHLAPGGVEPDIPRWIRTELRDLLETYPETPVPSWALHVLAPWAPSLKLRAAVPAVSAEGTPGSAHPEVVGAAIGAILMSLTGRTLIVVDAGLWPAPQSPADRVLQTLATSLRGPGAVLLASTPAQESWDPDGVRTVKLEPLRVLDLEALCHRWTGERDSRRLASWLLRITGGHPFFLHETIRWWEELGHVRIDEDHKGITFVDPIEGLPVPLFLKTVMDARYRRLAPASARLLHLLSRVDGRCELESLRDLSGYPEDDFDEALALLRRRGFLLRHTSRHPLALASPQWKDHIAEAVIQFPRNALASHSIPEDISASQSVLARTGNALDRLRRAKLGAEKKTWGKELARIYRIANHRLGPAWAAVRGRLAILAARGRLEEGSLKAVVRWTQWGRRQLRGERHPALRRELWRLEAEAHARRGNSDSARRARGEARDEALQGGHLLAGARLAAVVAEDLRRSGDLEIASRQGVAAARDLLAMGLVPWAERAGYTAVAALLDARKLERAEETRDRVPLSEAGRKETGDRLEALKQDPPLVLTASPPMEGWGWGLDHPEGWSAVHHGLNAIHRHWVRRGELRPETPALDDAREMDRFPVAGADLAEFELLARAQSLSASPDLGTRLESTIHRNRKLDPERNRFLARAIRPLLGDLPEFKKHLGSFLLEPVAPPHPPPTLRLHLLGRPRMETTNKERPLSLWPEWWLTLWSEVLALELTGRRMSRDEARTLLASATDTPPGDLDSLLYASNQELGSGERWMGGITAHQDELRLHWDGLWCDVREILRGLDPGEAATGPTTRALPDVVLSLVSGPLLPGVDSDRLQQLRQRMGRGLEAMLLARLQDPEPVPPESRVQWLEGFTLLLGQTSPALHLMAQIAPASPPPGIP